MKMLGSYGAGDIGQMTASVLLIRALICSDSRIRITSYFFANHRSGDQAARRPGRYGLTLGSVAAAGHTPVILRPPMPTPRGSGRTWAGRRVFPCVRGSRML